MNFFGKWSFIAIRMALVKDFLKKSYDNKLGPQFLLPCRNYIRPRISISSSCRSNHATFLSFQSLYRFYGTSSSVRDANKSIQEKEKEEKLKKKKQEPTKVFLITETQNIQRVTLEEAGKLAKKKLLHLIEVDPQSENLKTDTPVYKLVTTEQFYGENTKKKSSKDEDGTSKKVKDKEEKTIILKSKTSEHDVLVKVKNIKKWVEKGHTVRILIGQTNDTSQNPEPVYKIIEDCLKDEPMRIVQKVAKSSQIRFYVMPPKVTRAQIAQEHAKKQHKASSDGAAGNAEKSDDDEYSSDDESTSSDTKRKKS